jgi:hypothetical protein
MVVTAKPYEEPKADTADSSRPRQQGTLHEPARAEPKSPTS